MQSEEEEDQSKRTNVGKKWSEKDETYLLTNHLKGVHIPQIASFLHRTDYSVISRVYELAVRHMDTNESLSLEDVLKLYNLTDLEKLKMIFEKYQVALKTKKKTVSLAATCTKKPQKLITSFMIDKKAPSESTEVSVGDTDKKAPEVSVDTEQDNIFSSFCHTTLVEKDLTNYIHPQKQPETDIASCDQNEKKCSKYFTVKEAVAQITDTRSLPSTPSKFTVSSPLNLDQSKAVVAVTENRKNIFLTGEPGTGKTYTIQIIKETLLHQNKKVAVTAMTGTASVLANAKTLHSFLGIGLGKKDVDELVKDAYMKQKEKVFALQNTDVLIVDEVSMLDVELFNKISEYLKKIRRSKLPFGNIQMIFVGDFCQLPPVKGEYCFLSPLWKEASIETIFLTENVRQAKDPEFADMLRRLRWGYESMTEGDLAILEEMGTTVFPDSIVPTRLFPKNAQVDRINKSFFQCLIGSDDIIDTITCTPKVDSKDAMKFRTYAELTGITFDLELCIGTQVMITRNIDVDEGLVNGTRGVVSAIYRHDLSVDITLMDGRRAHIAYVEASFPVDKRNEITYRMMPLKYAWAISQHKCQGMTLDAIEIDLGEDIFENGQAYVALSRAEHRKSVRILNFDRFSFKTHVEVKKFYNK